MSQYPVISYQWIGMTSVPHPIHSAEMCCSTTDVMWLILDFRILIIVGLQPLSVRVGRVGRVGRTV